MPIQPQQFQLLDFDQANPMLAGMQKGQGLAQNFFNFPQELQAKILANQIAQVQAKYAEPTAQGNLTKLNQENQWNPDIWRSEINLRGSQSRLADTESKTKQYLLDHPGLLSEGVGKELAGLQAMGYNVNPGQNQSNPQNQSGQNGDVSVSPVGQANGLPLSNNQEIQFNTGNSLADALLKRKFAASNYQNLMAQGFNWVHAPVDLKTYMLAQAAGAGYDPSEAQRLFASGKTIPELLAAKGFDPNNPPDPDFLPTRGNIQSLKNRQSALNEIDTLGNFVREGLGPYSQTIMNFSPKQIVDAMSGKNKDQQAKFLAARMIAPELALVRSRLAQGPAGITAVNEIMQKSMMNMSALQSLVKPEIFDAAQKLADSTLKQAMLKASKAYQVKSSQDNDKSADPFGLL